MSMHFSRNVIIPSWFAIFALAAFVVPPFNFGFSLFMLVMGLAVPTIVYMLWQDPALEPVGIGPHNIDTKRHEIDGTR